MKAVEATGAEAAIDGVLAQADLHELSARDDAVLPPRDPRDLPVWVEFAADTAG